MRRRLQGYVPTDDPATRPLRELVDPQLPRRGRQQPLPEAVVLSQHLWRPDRSLEQLKRFEGMRVAVPPCR